MKVTITTTGKSDMAGKAKFPIKCPKCGHNTDHVLAELKRDPILTCRCGHKFKVETGGSAKAAEDEIRKLDRAINDLFKKR
ncbi:MULTISPECIES: hypothetical protein [unclassified Bradyrhizobium]|uniref:hypothetical protein n=1 Tax=unclassified Bradyrhizobium TaxID=2631580 RepID=UPI0024790683|nr:MULTISPECIES: hypothetical protein [unclassified Bradyrhizobium]WGS20816.1 hypothetical protein MTX22_03160 [Bradyrhizobium sp. ISRA463]WGS27713.1 hypothetical protein MTX19_01025 [Bradyrhizobium sp. ISRA464]